MEPAKEDVTRWDTNATIEKEQGIVEDIKDEGAEVTYTDQEERSLVRKLDFVIIPMMMVTYGLDYLDKAVFGAAALFGMLEDLDLVKVIGIKDGVVLTDTTRYSVATLIYYVGYFCGAYPWSVLAQKLPTGKVIAVACILWSLVGLTTPSCTTYTGILINRVFLGLLESGVGPIFTVYITYWWNRKEQVTRSGFWYCAGGAGSVIGPVLGWGTAKIRGPLHPWKYMFYILNAISLGWGLILLVFMPDKPGNTWWLNERQKQICVKRLQDEQTNSHETKFQFSQVKEALTSHMFWFVLAFSILANAPAAALSNFSPYVIMSMGFSSNEALLLATPLGAMTVISLLSASFIARRFPNMRYYLTVFLLLVELLGALIIWKSPLTKRAARYAGLLLFPFVIAALGMVVSLVSSNVGGHTKKYVVGTAVFIGTCFGSIMGSLLVSASPAPMFNTSFLTSAIFTIVCVVLAIGSRLWQGRENKKRDRQYGPPVIISGLASKDMTDRENKNFRYVL
ncbi:allantoate permease [Trichomonascus vanleenenianus]|uniref:allantoate permease n=1 Tax=Trichomonascus vanleenenianus TaxID=2268995 RepID=UPI003ECBA993